MLTGQHGEPPMNYRHAYHAGNFADVVKHVVLSRIIDYLKRNFDSPIHFYYGHYYAAHAMHSYAGVNPKDGPREWAAWYNRLVTYFVRSGWQAADGSWGGTNRREVGPVYQTSIAVIALSVPAHYLPIFQR